MAFALFALLAWITLCIFSLMPKSLLIIENIIVFFLLLMCSTMSATIVTLNMNRIDVSTQHSLFLCFWLKRTVIIPSTMLICVNTFFLRIRFWEKAFVLAAAYGYLALMDLLELSYGIVAFLRWNTYYFLALVSFVFLLILPITACIRKLPGRDQYHDCV